ncbi:hypothetical protein MKW92_003347 [Papaver armeniacum]|nr:hypothetical protein MKW92_003347 [Papaver armeniacum]
MESSWAYAASIPSVGFPLGIALLLILVFGVSGFFSCCYNWNKLRSLRRSFSPSDENHQEEDTDLEGSGTNNHNPVVQSLSSIPSQIYLHGNQNTNKSIPVIMPGDNIAKFVAISCPYDQFRPDKVIN